MAGPTEIQRLPLLPYERQLIQALGCSEEEYREYRQQLINHGLRRPAGYEHIPDVRADVVSIVVSLAVGIAFSAAAALLAPKPKPPRQQEQRDAPEPGGSKRLSDQNGAARFNSTQGFQGQQSIAALGATVAIPFGRYQRNEDYCEGRPDYFTGGLSVAPVLVWSRMFSYGNHQGFKGLYVVGENMIPRDQIVFGGDTRQTRPDIESILFGTMPLSSLSDQQYAVYWNANFNEGRVKARDLLYGTRGYPAAGDPQTQDDIFNCPLIEDEFGLGFCMSMTPSGNTSFGAYSPVGNGTAYKTNFKIVPRPQRADGGDEDPEGRIKYERRKIAGINADDPQDGMKGLGRGYSSLMGIISLNGREPTAPEQDVFVQVGDECDFLIRGHQLSVGDAKITTESDIKVDDINNALNNRRANADDQLQVGEMFVISRTIWQVIRRSGGENGVWRPGGNDVRITLRMSETTSPAGSTIGIAGRRALGYGGYMTSEGTDFDKSNGWLGPAWYPLCKVSQAVVRNTRPTETTELGIRSQVWNRANGICNFNSLITPRQLVKYENPSNDEENGTAIQSGVMTQYMQRTSVFTLFLRPVGLDNNGQPYLWQPIGEQFCITGTQPVDQFNFVRIKSLDGAKEMEYRFVPKPGSDLKFYTPPEAQFFRLNAKTGTLIGDTYSTVYGNFRLTIVGEIITFGDTDPRRDLQFNPELKSGGTPDRTEVRQVPTGVNPEITQPTNVTQGRMLMFNWEFLGDPNNLPGQVRSFTIDASYQSKSMKLRVECESLFIENEDQRRKLGSDRSWFTRRVDIVSTNDDFRTGDFVVRREDTDNPVSRKLGVSSVTYRYTVTNVRQEITVIRGEPERIFDGRSQIADVSHYDEIDKSNFSGPEHEVVYVNETITPSSGAPPYPFTVIGTAVRSSNALQSVEQLRLWMNDGVPCKNLIDNSYGPSNLFSDLVYYLLTDNTAGLGTYVSNADQWIDEDDFVTCAKYLKANKIFFDGVVADRVNIRNYLGQLAPYNLCNFVIAAGRMAVTPALPFDPNTFEIDPFALPIAAYFGEGNIIEGSYAVEYLEETERQNFKAVVQYRAGERDKLPYNDVILVRWKDLPLELPQEVFDLSEFCTSREHALKVARFILSVRRRIDHSIKFQTLPQGLNLKPGQYINVVTSAAPESSAFIGVIDSDGYILSADEVSDGTHQISIYKPGYEQTQEVEMEVENGRALDSSLHGAVFSSLVPRPERNTYLVEQLDLNEDGLVEVSASHFPIGGDLGGSIIAKDVLDLPFDGEPDLRCQPGNEGNRFFYID